MHVYVATTTTTCGWVHFFYFVFPVVVYLWFDMVNYMLVACSKPMFLHIFLPSPSLRRKVGNFVIIFNLFFLFATTNSIKAKFLNPFVDVRPKSRRSQYLFHHRHHHIRHFWTSATVRSWYKICENIADKCIYLQISCEIYEFLHLYLRDEEMWWVLYTFVCSENGTQWDHICKMFLKYFLIFDNMPSRIHNRDI